jgi:hypothetical protein
MSVFLALLTISHIPSQCSDSDVFNPNTCHNPYTNIYVFIFINTFIYFIHCMHAGTQVLERLDLDDSMLCHQHLMSKSGVPEPAYHASLAAAPDRVVLLTTQGVQGLGCSRDCRLRKLEDSKLCHTMFCNSFVTDRETSRCGGWRTWAVHGLVHP